MNSSKRGTWRRRLVEAMLALHFTLAPSSVPSWRLDPTHRPVALLMVGEPVRLLEPRLGRNLQFRDTMGSGRPE